MQDDKSWANQNLIMLTSISSITNYVCVDNLGVWGVFRLRVEAAMKELCSHLESLGLSVHERQVLRTKGPAWEVQ